MSFSIIVAMDKNHLIGDRNDLPWHLPADLKHFKSHTIHKPVVMGRTTYESIVERLGRPLPERDNIVLSSGLDAEGIEVCRSIDEVLMRYQQAAEVMIIGGASIYKAFLPFVNKLYLTKIDAEFSGDTYFPAIDLDGWRLVHEETHAPDERNTYSYTFLEYIKP